VTELEQPGVIEADRLQTAARDHLMLHFTEMAAFDERDIPIITRGDGCYVIDSRGRRYIDGLSGLFCVNIGHGFGDELGQAAHDQMRELGYTSNWTIAHPRSIELADRITALAPAGMSRVFFTSGGGEAVDAAWKLARQYHVIRGDALRTKAISRKLAYHGTNMGALSFTVLTSARTPFEPLAVPTTFVSNTCAYRHPLGDDPAAFCRWLLEELEETIDFVGPETIAMMIAEPVQNSGGAFVPPPGYWAGLRELCDRHGILLCADEVICAWGRLGTWFGGERFEIAPDIITFAKGLTSAYFSMGGVLMHERVAEPLMRAGEMFMHGLTFGGHPVGSAIALKNLEIMEREQMLDNVKANEPWLQSQLDAMRTIPIVGDVRGMGHFWAIELVADQQSTETFTPEEAKWLLRDFLSSKLEQRGLIARLDDRGDPVVQVSPPLVADREVLGRMLDIIATSLQDASDAFAARGRI
jgi:adenosylmethionine-8-amino-7-oxononanoate aminotransferase